MCVCMFVCVCGEGGGLIVGNLITPAQHGKFIHDCDYCIIACVLRD